VLRPEHCRPPLFTLAGVTHCVSRPRPPSLFRVQSVWQATVSQPGWSSVCQEQNYKESCRLDVFSPPIFIPNHPSLS
jgi:hypothetical protein